MVSNTTLQTALPTLLPTGKPTLSFDTSAHKAKIAGLAESAVETPCRIVVWERSDKLMLQFIHEPNSVPTIPGSSLSATPLEITPEELNSCPLDWLEVKRYD
ncbi:hypothetical protein Misp04_45160 [Micromonospora sp. NBRC 101691]|nr:hypothetical protein Misp04_45160 [Micromonospora sp. NBRC 101691]